MDWSWLLFLACPLMMIVMMFSMRGGHGNGSGDQRKGNQEETQKMQRELEELKAQNEQMKIDIQKLR